MATVDEQIQLAEQIARALPGIPRNEWMRWLQIAERYGLDRATSWANKLSKDMTMRPRIQKANRLIAQAVGSNRQVLQKLPVQQCLETLGYVGRMLKVAERQKKPPVRQKRRR